MKQFLRYILTLVVILLTTTPAWAECVIFNDGNEHQIMNWLSSNSTKTYTFDSPLPCGTLTFDIRLYWSATQGITVKATYSDGTSETILSNSRNSSNTVDLNSKKDIKSLSFSANGTERKWISNVKLTRRVSISASPNPITLAKTAIGETSAAETLTVTYSNIGTTQYVTPTSTADFTISPQQTSFDACAGTATYKITFHPQGIEGGERIATFTIVGRESVSSPNKASVTITAKGIAKGQPKHTWNGNTQYYVGDQINLPATWVSSNTNAPRTYSVISHTESSEINEGATTPYINGSNQLILEKAGTLKIQMYQQGDDTYSPLTSEVTITIVKRPTDFSLNFANEYFVDDEINKSTFFTNATNSEVAVQVSDKTADNRALFTYNGSILKANGATLNADAETTTITVTQPENYKWTSCTQEKNVTVKKHQTNFAWNDGESLECYVDDQTDITNLYTKASDNTLPVNFNIEVVERGYGNTDVVSIENGVLTAIGEGKVVVTASQAVDRKWTDFSTPITINVKRYDVSATLNPTTTVWNATHSNPFSVSISPANGETITDFSVGESSNSAIATYNANSKTIQTYYTSGSADFQVTRLEDRKYNALSQTLTLTVNANTSGCNPTPSHTTASVAYAILSSTTYSEIITYQGVGDTLVCQIRVEGIGNASNNHYLTPQYSTTDNGDFTDFPNSQKTVTSNSWSNDIKFAIPDGTKRIRFKRTAASGGTRTIAIRNIAIIRAPSLKATPNPLSLPKTAVGTPDEAEFILEWNTCADIILLTHKNPHFTLNHYSIESNAGKGTTKIIVSCDAQEVTTYRDTIIIYDQTQMIPVPVECVVRHKIQPAITVPSTYNMLVDSDWENVFTYDLDSIETSLPTENESDPFYYTIEHNLDGNDVRKPGFEDKVITYDAQNNKIFAHNEGTAIIKLIHNETDGYYGKTATCTLTVSKHDVELQWKDPVYFNDTISNYFTTTNTASSIVIESQTDTDVAKLTDEFNPTSNNSRDLITFNKEDSTTVTVSQVETYYWNGYSIPHTITPIDPSNHVTFTIDSEARMWVFQPTSNEQLSWSNGIKVTKGDLIDANWDDRYVIINFTGIPKDMSFSFEPSVDGTTYEYWYVDESPNGQNGTWTRAWNTEGEGDNYERGTVTEHPLLPTTRYLKLCYSGNYGGIFKNLHVTELNEFRAVDSQNKTLDKDTLDFGANQVYRNKTRTFDLRYANPGYKITVESTNPKFTVTPDFIGDIGGEHHGTRTITVSYTSTVPDTISGEDMIIINDEIGNTDTIRLYASSYKAEQVLHWRADFEKIPQPIIRRKNGDITDAAWATSQLPVTYTSSNENVIKISDDRTTLIPVAEGEAEITAYQLGNEMWLPADPITKTFIVTEKLLQYIIWDDDLTNIIKEDINPQTLTLTAQVYLQQEDGTVVFSQEQTNNLKYQSGNDNIVSAVGSTLTIHNVGRTTLTATVEGNNDYATASMTKTVIVRSATPGCDDNLLYHHEGDPIQFFQYNLNEIAKDPIALDRSKGEAGYVVVSHYGQSWNLAIQYYYAEIRVEQSLDNGSTWNIIETIQPVKNQENIDSIPLSRQATHIRFVRNYGGQGYQFLYNIDVHPAQYIEAQDVVDFGEIHVGSRETRTFPLHYSNIKHSLSPVPSTLEVTATPNTFGECSGFGTQDISVTWLPSQVSDNATATITFTDPNSGMEKVVTLVAKVFKGTQNIIWDNIPNIIEDCGSILFPEKTTANLSITWRVIEGNEFADFNEQGMLELYKNGTITVQATQEGTANYEPLTPVQYTFVIQLQTIFVGTEDSDWHNPNNWTMCRLPYPTEVVTMEHPATLSTHATVAEVIFSTNGSIHITHTGGLTINEVGVTNAAADGSSIIIDNNPQGAGFLLISPSAPETNKYPYFTMNFTTRAFNEGVPRDETWQYMGAPGNNATFKNLDSQTLIYHWDETTGWTPYTVNGSLPTWNGYALTQSIQPNQTYQITAQAMQGSQTINLTRTEEGMKGDNLFVNSFTAPIDITKINPTTDVTGDWDYQTFYLFNTGSWNDWQGVNPDHKHDDASSPGHYYTIPILSAQYLDDAQTVIPPMQGVYVHTEAPATITLDYSKHVWNGTPNNTPMRAPQKQAPDFRRIRIQASSQNSGADRMYIIQESSTTRGYDNGYDGKNINAKGQVNIYTNEPFGKMEVSCANNIDSMYIGFRAGSDSQYQLTFGSLVGDSLYLKDLNDNTIIRMEEGGIYHFFAEPNSVNHSRFQILLHPSELAGDNTTTGDHQVCQAKIWIDNQYLYITDAPIESQAIIYAISGQRVASYTVNDSYYTIPLSSLNSGIYILQINNQRYKFVWK